MKIKQKLFEESKSIVGDLGDQPLYFTGFMMGFEAA